MDHRQVTRFPFLCLEQSWYPLPFQTGTPTVSGHQEFMANIRNPFMFCVTYPTWKTLAHTLQLGSSGKKKIKIFTCTVAQQCPKGHMHCHSLLHVAEHLLAQQEPCHQNWWTGHFRPVLSNSVLFQTTVPAPMRVMQAVIYLFFTHCKPM